MTDKRIAPGLAPDEIAIPEPKTSCSQRRGKVVAGVVAVFSVVLIGVSALFLVPAIGQDSVSDALQTTEELAATSAGDQESPSIQDTVPPGENTLDAAPVGDGASTGVAPHEEATLAGAESGSSGSSSSSSGGSSGSIASFEGSSSRGEQSLPDNTVTVSVSISSSTVGNPVSGGTTVSFAKGATVYDALMACGLSVNASSGPLGVYVNAIGGLAEFDHGGGSGWKYAVNGNDGAASCGGYVLSDGDVVSWRYVLSQNG